jgi:hypothetical protein
MRFAIIAVTSCLLGASSASAADLQLPLGASFCESRANVEFGMEDPRELADDVIESTVSVWGLEGFVTATFERDRLVNLRVRFFDEGEDMPRVRKKLEGMMGPGGDSGRKTHWSPGGARTVTLRLQSEQIYVTFEIDPDSCGVIEAAVQGLTDQEKADLESVRKKQAIGFDPYEDVDDTEPVIKKKPEKDETEDAKEEEEEETPDPKDLDIDW